MVSSENPHQETKAFTQMGSTITIVNDTDTDWSCKVGPDQKAMKIASYSTIFSGLMTGAMMGTNLVHLATGAMPKAAAISNSVRDTAVPSTGAWLGTAVAGVADFAFRRKGFTTIRSNDRHEWKRSLSLWQQCECVRTILDDGKLFVDHIYIRPIFSPSKVGKNHDFSIKEWIHRRGYRRVELKLEGFNLSNTTAHMSYEPKTKRTLLRQLRTRLRNTESTTQ